MTPERKGSFPSLTAQAFLMSWSCPTCSEGSCDTLWSSCALPPPHSHLLSKLL